MCANVLIAQAAEHLIPSIVFYKASHKNKMVLSYTLTNVYTQAVTFAPYSKALY